MRLIDQLCGRVGHIAGVGHCAVLGVAVHRGDRVGPEGRCGVDQRAVEVVDVDATEPWRGAGLPDLQELLPVGEGDQRQPGLDLLHPHQGTPVEALDRHPVQHPGGADLPGHHLDELLTWRGLLRCAGLDLGLDVHLHPMGATDFHKVEHLAQQRHP